MPFRRAQGRLWGPGVLDMKAGLAFFIFAMRALVELDIPVPNEVALLVNPDEETGSKASRAGTEALASKSHAVLVLEPGTGLEGKAKTARKGIGAFDFEGARHRVSRRSRFRERLERGRRNGPPDRSHLRLSPISSEASP